MQKLWQALVNGEKTDLWDSFGEGLFEYRRNVNHGRIFRMFFYSGRKKDLFPLWFYKENSEHSAEGTGKRQKFTADKKKTDRKAIDLTDKGRNQR